MKRSKEEGERGGREILMMKRRNGKVKNAHETGRKKDEIKEQAVMMKGNKKRKESSYLQ